MSRRTFMPRSQHRPLRRTAAGALAGVTIAALSAAPALAGTAHSTGAPSTRPAGSASAQQVLSSLSSRACPPDGVALGYSDALDKVVYDGATVGGLSDLAYDARSHSYVSSVDNHGTDPSRIWFYRNLNDPVITRDPLVLKMPNGTPYDGTTADNEGLAVLPDGDYLVSSEIEPSIRIFGRDGVQQGELRVPKRFDVAPAGQSTANTTLEGLTVSPDGRQIVAGMEGTLSGDIGADGTDTYRRFLVYDLGPRGHYSLTREVGYQVDPGNRISEVQLYADGKLLVMEAAYSTTAGNSIELYAVPTLATAPDVTRIGNLSRHPDLVVPKQLAVNVTGCPTLGAPSREPQTNPLMDNYEGMTTSPVLHGLAYRVSLISDDNFSPTQYTRVLNLAAVLP